jgi:small subunit ribosomal protein S5
VMQSLGIHNVRTKILGSNNPHSVLRATFDGLLKMKDPVEVARLRGKEVGELL